MRRSTDLALVLLCLGVTLVWGYGIKAACAEAGARNVRPFDGCYSDIVPLYTIEGIAEGRLPLLEPCPYEERVCDEYPVVQMWLLWAAGQFGDDLASFFQANVALLGLAAITTALALHALSGRRALFFAAAPSLVLYAFHNWDLYGIAIAALAMLAFGRGRYGVAGALIGIGVSTKLFPALLLVPLIADRLRRGDREGSIRMSAIAVGTWMAINVPFAIVAWERWSTFFTFHAARPPEYTTLWYLACVIRTGANCTPITLINVESVLLFSLTFLTAWAWRRKFDPGFERWTLIFPAFVLFLLWNKVYSPQYSLWLLPVFALAFPRKWFFVAFSIADVAVGRLLFSWFGSLFDVPGAPAAAYRIAVVVRALVLGTCVVLWTIGRDRDRSVTTEEPQEDPAVAMPG